MSPRVPAAVLPVAVLLALAGCVERKMLIRSDPPGALLSIDGEETGLVTPAEVPFDFGGTRAVTLSSAGHKVLDARAELSDPWFTYFPLDIGAEFLWPGTIRDGQTFDFKLEPYATELTAGLMAAAKKRLGEVKLRAAAHRAGGSEGPGEATEPVPAEAAPKK